MKKRALEVFQKGYDLQIKGNLGDAIILFKQSIEIFPTAEAHTYLGWSYSFQERYDEAIKECCEAIRVDPDLGNPYNDIGAYLVEKGKLHKAIPWFKRAMKAKRYEARAFPHMNLGRVYEQLGRWWDALAEYRKAANIRPDYWDSIVALRRLQARLN